MKHLSPRHLKHPSAIRRHLLALAGSLLMVLTGVAYTGSALGATIVVPYPPGSGPDVLARGLAERMGRLSGETVIVENKPGANAIVGSAAVAEATPDGKTLLLVDRMTLAVNPLLYNKLPYAAKDLTGVSDIATVNLLFVCRTDAPYKTWSDMIAFARKDPGALMVGTGGQGSVHHLSLELVERHYGVKMTDVPYKGISPAVVATLGGDIPCVITGQETVLEHIRSGKLRALVYGGAQRSALLPDVPTLAEVGAPDDLLLATHFTLHAPAKTPKQTIRQINAEVAKVQAEPEFVQRYAARGLIISPSTPQAVDAAISADGERLGKLIRDAKIKLN